MHPATALAAALLVALPFPPPKQVSVTEATRCDWGTVITVNEPPNTLILKTQAGMVTYQSSADTPVLLADGKSAGGVGALKPGQMVRVYYVVDNGAKLTEVDVQ